MTKTRRAGQLPFPFAVRGRFLLIGCAGRWVARRLNQVSKQLNRLESDGISKAELDLGAISELDSAGACLLARAEAALEAQGISVDVVGARESVAGMRATVARHLRAPAAMPPRPGILKRTVIALGSATVGHVLTAKALTEFLGQAVVMLLRAVLHPGRIRFTALVSHMEQSGLRALPIVGLISFLVGVVLAFQGADQLARFGAQIFTINLVAVGVLREMGILLTAIIIAGRSGSAFTAQIGTMKVNEEVDALQTIGLDPMDVLVMPRILGLVLVMPLLTFYADIMGLLGGAVMVMTSLDMSPSQLLRLLNDAARFNDFLVGMIKAPIFAFIIALVGCYEGFQVQRNAESVGRQTTKAVVEAIFLVIVLDALFSIFFTTIGL